MLSDIYSKEGQIIGQVELNDDIFGIEPNEDAMHRSVVALLAHKRQGTHKVKTRSEVSGGGKKPWRQKGRGTARSGSSRSPVWVGGGTMHGPFPHLYNVGITKKLRQLAKKSALSARCSENNIQIVEDFTFDKMKTKDMFQILKNLTLSESKTLVLLPIYDKILYYSSRNIEGLSIHPAGNVSAYDILCHRKILIFKSSIEILENSLKN